MALGEVDYGLLGLVGSLTAFISFINSLMASAIGRFFAFSIGAAVGKGDKGLETCQRWFNVALLIHSTVPILLLIIGYPVGEWAIRSFLTIPGDRIADCVWVWRFVCISCFLTMATVPFNAMYVAKQYIAELTIYTILTTTLNAGFLYYIVTHPGIWLVKLSLWSCILGMAPQLCISMRAFWIFPECKLIPKYMKDWDKIREVSIYAFYRFFGALGLMIRRQGIDILVNKLLGPARNAAVNVGGVVSSHSNSLSAAFLTALSPAITNAYGARDLERVRKLSFFTCKVSTVMTLVFAIPLFLEANEVFRLWLKNPPEGCVPICLGLLGVLIVDNLVCGHFIAISAEGTIRGSQISYLIVTVCSVILIWILMLWGLDLSAVAYGLVTAQLSLVGLRLYFARAICGFSVREWIWSVALPLIVCSLVSFGIGWLIVISFEESFRRVVLTTIVVNGVFIPLVWFLSFNIRERLFFKDHLRDVVNKVKTRVRM